VQERKKLVMKKREKKMGWVKLKDWAPAQEQVLERALRQKPGPRGRPAAGPEQLHGRRRHNRRPVAIAQKHRRRQRHHPRWHADWLQD
jgi:hypothetical protein